MAIDPASNLVAYLSAGMALSHSRRSLNLHEQRELVQRYAADNRYEIVAEFVETGHRLGLLNRTAQG